MNISAISSSGSGYATTTTDSVKKLEQQITRLNKQIQEENQSKDDTKSKETKVKALQQQIEMIQMQIDQIQSEKIKQVTNDESSANNQGINNQTEGGDLRHGQFQQQSSGCACLTNYKSSDR